MISFYAQILATIGEQLDPLGNFITGISMVMKTKGARIEIWVKNIEDKAAIATVGRKIRALNIVEAKETIEFRKHGGDEIYQL